MHQAKLLVVALMTAIPLLGCGDSNSTPAQTKELTPEAIAEQEAVLQEAEAAERMRKK